MRRQSPLDLIILFSVALISFFPNTAAQANDIGSCGEVSDNTLAKRKLLYEATMTDKQNVKDWRMEGGGEISFSNDWMMMKSPDQKQDHVFWCPIDFPDSFISELEVKNLNPDAGLSIIFFAAQGENGEDIFDPALPARDGLFRKYTKGSILSYHISYYANSPKNPARPNSHLRKNNKFALVSTGPPGIKHASTDIHRLKLIKNKARIQFFVDDLPVIDWTDDGISYGKRLKGGKIGLRQMRWTNFAYRNFRVWAIDPCL